MPKQQTEDKSESLRIEENKRREQTVQIDENKDRTKEIEKKKKGQKDSSVG